MLIYYGLKIGVQLGAQKACMWLSGPILLQNLEYIFTVANGLLAYM